MSDPDSSPRITRVWLVRPIDDRSLESLRERLDRGVELQVGPREESETAGSLSAGGQILPGPEILVDGRPEEQWLIDHQATLRSLVIPWAGLPKTTGERLRNWPSIRVYNLHHNAAPTAEMSLALLLAAAKRVVEGDQALRRGDWRIRYDLDERGPLLAGRTALILGYGSIGRRIARALNALDMNVLGVRRSLPEGVQPGEIDRETGSAVFGRESLDELLPKAEVLMVSLPATDQTTACLDATRLDRLPTGAVVVNVGRAAVIDEWALYERLADQRIGAAGLDVWWRYPEDEPRRRGTLPADAPFGSLPNVVLSPHRAGHTDRTEALRMQHLADLLNRLHRDDPSLQALDLSRGY